MTAAVQCILPQMLGGLPAQVAYNMLPDEAGELTAAALTSVATLVGYALMGGFMKRVLTAGGNVKAAARDGGVGALPKPTKVGLDIGGVIVDGNALLATSLEAGGEDHLSGEVHDGFVRGDFLRTPAVQGSVEGVASLVRRLGAENVFLVSKAGPKVEERTREWLEHKRFFEKTGLLAENLIFCRERAEKAGICSRLAISHLVDDHFDVLRHLEETPTTTKGVLFSPEERDLEKWDRKFVEGASPAERRRLLADARKRVVWSWDELLGLLLAGVPEYHDEKKKQQQERQEESSSGSEGAAGVSSPPMQVASVKKPKNKAPTPSSLLRAASARPLKPQQQACLSSWSCPRCTLDNDNVALACGACEAPRPTPEGFWRCGGCTLAVAAQTPRCTACGQSRPVAVCSTARPVVPYKPFGILPALPDFLGPPQGYSSNEQNQ